MKFYATLLFLSICQLLQAQSIFEAYDKNDLTKLRALLEAGADPNELRDSNKQPLMFNAAWDNNVEAASLLLKFGAKVDLPSGPSQITPMLPACQQNSYEMVVFLVTNGANPKQRFAKAGNQTPIRFACKTGNIDLVKFLLEQGAELEDQPNDRITPLIQAAKSNHAGLVKFLLDRGALVNAQGRDGETALNQAVKNNNVEIVKLLLEKGASVDLLDEAGNSTFQLAKKTKNKELIGLIKSKQ
jgi:ankyrin repeat protein